MQEANSLGHSSSLNLHSAINEITSAEANEMSHSRYNNYSKKPWNKQDGYKGKNNGDKKLWFNKDNKPWNKDNKHQNKEAKPKDTCITVSKDVKYFFPTGYNGQIFSAVTKLLEEKIKQVKRACDPNTKTINAIECESFCNIFRILEQLYNATFMQVVGETNPKILGNDTD